MNGYLLDTHAALWWWTDSPKLGGAARDVIRAETSRILLSVASVWEIGIKSHAGRLPEVAAFRSEYAALMKISRFELIAMTDDHALTAAYLDGLHRDPFDRLIAAQALIGDLVVITRDPQIAAFGCKVLW